jgi:hypothetical protein
LTKSLAGLKSQGQGLGSKKLPVESIIIGWIYNYLTTKGETEQRPFQELLGKSVLMAFSP